MIDPKDSGQQPEIYKQQIKPPLRTVLNYTHQQQLFYQKFQTVLKISDKQVTLRPLHTDAKTHPLQQLRFRQAISLINRLAKLAVCAYTNDKVDYCLADAIYYFYIGNPQLIQSLTAKNETLFLVPYFAVQTFMKKAAIDTLIKTRQGPLLFLVATWDAEQGKVLVDKLFKLYKQHNPSINQVIQSKQGSEWHLLSNDLLEFGALKLFIDSCRTQAHHERQLSELLNIPKYYRFVRDQVWSDSEKLVKAYRSVEKTLTIFNRQTDYKTYFQLHDNVSKFNRQSLETSNSSNPPIEAGIYHEIEIYAELGWISPMEVYRSDSVVVIIRTKDRAILQQKIALPIWQPVLREYQIILPLSLKLEFQKTKQYLANELQKHKEFMSGRQSVSKLQFFQENEAMRVSYQFTYNLNAKLFRSFKAVRKVLDKVHRIWIPKEVKERMEYIYYESRINKVFDKYQCEWRVDSKSKTRQLSGSNSNNTKQEEYFLEFSGSYVRPESVLKELHKIFQEENVFTRFRLDLDNQNAASLDLKALVAAIQDAPLANTHGKHKVHYDEVLREVVIEAVILQRVDVEENAKILADLLMQKFNLDYKECVVEQSPNCEVSMLELDIESEFNLGIDLSVVAAGDKTKFNSGVSLSADSLLKQLRDT